MVGFSIMIWFVAIILYLSGVSLLRGNIALLHGRQFEDTEDKVGFAKAMGKIILFMATALLACGIFALLVGSTQAVVYAVLAMLGMTAISCGWFIAVVRRYCGS